MGSFCQNHWVGSVLTLVSFGPPYLCPIAVELRLNREWRTCGVRGRGVHSDVRFTDHHFVIRNPAELI